MREPTPGNAENSGPVAKNLASTRVLVVDDEPLIRWSVGETLARRGCAVTQAGDGRSAIAHMVAAASPFDVVLLDLRLPDSRDLSLLSWIRGHSPASTVILMTAFGTPEVVEQALALGAVRVVTKPFELHDLAALIDEAPARHRA